MRVAVGAAALVLLAGCSPGQAASTVAGFPCTVTASTPEVLERALHDAGAATTVCVLGDGLADTDVVVRTSGEPGRPVVVVSTGTRVRSLVVEADHVVVQGFVAADGDGIVLSGTDLVARGNEVRAAAEDGISCEDPCADVVIEDNVVVGADGSGILVEGQRITLHGNQVSGSVRREAGDADGVRFFGTDVRIQGNTVTDIKDDGYAGDPPHTDCFQTFDNSRLPTVGAVIADNVCRNVDHQCLIATAEESAGAGEVGRSRDIEFVGNQCQVEGRQAVLVQWVPEVVVRGNTFEGPNLDRAAIFLGGSLDGAFVDNTVPDSVSPYQLDEESAEGFITDQPN